MGVRYFVGCTIYWNSIAIENYSIPQIVYNNSISSQYKYCYCYLHTIVLKRDSLGMSSSLNQPSFRPPTRAPWPTSRTTSTRCHLISPWTRAGCVASRKSPTCWWPPSNRLRDWPSPAGAVSFRRRCAVRRRTCGVSRRPRRFPMRCRSSSTSCIACWSTSCASREWTGSLGCDRRWRWARSWLHWLPLGRECLWVHCLQPYCPR